MKHPEHIDGFVIRSGSRFSQHSDNYHLFYQVLCPCKETLFHVFKSNKKSVVARCSKCGREIKVYDLKYYPAATKPKGEEEFLPALSPAGHEIAEVYVMYEYAELDADEAFDPNGITWCKVYLADKNNEPKLIVDDETA